MADPLISLDTEHAFAQPGGQARVTVTVTNPGTVVEGYQLLVLGPAAAWAEVVPSEVSVYPQQEVTAAVVFSPPTGASAPGGLQPFGVLARSTLDPQVSAVAEGDLEIGEVHGLQAKIIPVTSTGRWRGRHVVQLSNFGNAYAQLRMTASDPDDALGFYVSPEFVNLPPGGRAAVRLSARTKHPFLRGTPVRLPFQVVGERLDADAEAPPKPGLGYGDPSRPVVDAALSQKPILSKGLVTLLALLLAGVVALVAYPLLRKPTAEETLASRGSPPKPQQLTVTPTGPDAVTVSWTPVDLAEHYNLQRVDPQTEIASTVTQADGALGSFAVSGLPPQTLVCFKLSVTRGGLTGPLSDKACSTTQPLPPSPSPTPPPLSQSPTPTPTTTPTPTATSTPTSPSPSPSFSPGDPNSDTLMKQAWIAVAAELPTAGHLDADAQNEVKALTDQGVPAPVKYLNTRFYPRLRLGAPTPPPTPAAQESYLMYLGPFPTVEEAQNACPQITNATGGTCQLAQPDPPP